MNFPLMYRLLLALLMLVCLLSACRTQPPRTAKPTDVFRQPKVAHQVAMTEADYRTERAFNKLFLEAVRQKQREQVDAEFELLDAALRLKPAAPEAVYEMAVLKLSYSTYSDTLARAEGDSLLRRATELAPDNLYYKETLATYLANSAQYREAIRLYEEIADANLTYETLANLAWLYKTSGDYAGAIRTLERLERLDGRSEALSMEKFQTYLAMKDDEHAYQALEELCAEYPLDLRYRVLMGDLYDQHGYHERALDIYRDVLTAEPDNSYAQLSLLAYYKAARADSLYLDLLNRVVLNPRTQSGARLEAMRAYAVDNIKARADSTPVLNLFRQALAEPQENRDMAELQAYYMIERKMPADSVMRVMYRILEIEPDYTKARLQILQYMLLRGDMNRVAQICREGELYDPSEITFYYYEGEAHYRSGNNAEAIRVLQRGAERVDENTDPQLASDVLALLGDVLHDSHLTEEAYLAYDRSLEYNPLNLFCLNNYAYFLSVEGRNLEKAEPMSRRTVEVEPQNATYLDTYAWILFKLGRYREAQIYMEEALRYTPETEENASIFDHAGDIFYHAGDKKLAPEYWKKALQLTTDKAQKKVLQRKIWRRRP